MRYVWCWLALGCARERHTLEKAELEFLTPSSGQILALGPQAWELDLQGVASIDPTDLSLVSNLEGNLDGSWSIDGTQLLFSTTVTTEGEHTLAAVWFDGEREAEAVIQAQFIGEPSSDTDTEDTNGNQDTESEDSGDFEEQCYYRNFFTFLAVPSDRLPLYWGADEFTRSTAQQQDLQVILELVSANGSEISAAWLDLDASADTFESAIVSHVQLPWSDADFGIPTDGQGRRQISLNTNPRIQGGDPVAVDVECDAEWTRAERILEAPFEMPPLPVAFGSGSETTPWTSGAVTLDVSQTVEIQVSPPLDAMGDPELANDFFVIVWPHHVEEPMPFGVIGPSLALELPNRAAVDGTYTLEIPASLFQPTFSDTNGELVTTHHQLDIGLRSDGASALTSVNVFPE